ncbi:hypothetical protein [Streptomyces sp. N35]|uniref:hypothetical protein n=1 Tax=Streptomyces sp. N35 TaxID=2795730 RepID=UPI0018F40440|nr:hypothetical protein [Streptomyces sp. N35]
MAQGTGNSLGAALSALLHDHGGHMRRLSSYHAKHWHAQLSQLTATKRGYEALERAGLSVTPATLMKWLSDAEYNVRRNYIDVIHAAYEDTAMVPGPIPDSFKHGQFEITGVVKTGDDERFRGGPSASGRTTAPFRIDGRNGDWTVIERKWLAGTLEDEDFEEDFIDYVIVEDIGDGSDGEWEFPGSSYTVTI